MISDQERWDVKGRMSVKRKKGPVNQEPESPLRGVDLESMQKMTCLVSVTLSVGE